MAKFSGSIGYVTQVETVPGVWEDQTTEKNYRGEEILNQQRWQTTEKVNDDLTLDNSISVIADAWAYANLGQMKYIVWHGQKWKIQSLSIKRPRIILQIGGIYNGRG